MNLAIETHGLTKLYSGLHSVNHVNLQVPQYSIYGFLGPNGAGKSTTMKMILGLVRPSQGVVTISEKSLPGQTGWIFSVRPVPSSNLLLIMPT